MQPFHVAEVFTGSPGIYVLKDTIAGFSILSGDHDHLPEQAFVGSIEQAVEKAAKL